ncbi:calcium-transporting ATPase 9, plasma membrane-type-like isoform X2 [Salvia miltiorrhiza]|uniref:calcium-transporting ATPase 9, plasma membrane-type-like isoform X2 n=1 Tax=Salvia miltiorrhiza TaxID=226208 RepID=UPI0025ACF282|nr:calcium-transporting ATPase 9, plasma membrane-type-like isoform X2 [Salvia miltiorrhiza]
MTTGDEDEIHHDLESGAPPDAPEDEVGSAVDEEFSDPFDIGNTKNASHNLLKRWRQAALVLNASRRFRYTLDLKKDEEQEKRRRMIRAHAQVIRAALLFKLAGQRAIVLGTAVIPPSPSGPYGISPEQLSSMNRDHNIAAFQQYGGVKGISAMLRTDHETGISGDDNEFAQRRDAFGSNTYPVKKGRTFWMFLWEAWQDTTLIILIIAAIASLGLGIKTEGLSEGWYDGGSITFAVLLVIIVTATSDYRQSLQFQNLNEEKRNIQVEVIRGGRREKVSIYDIVVGDVVPLKIGDQVPADGLVTTSHSLAIDESSMTGESKIIQKDQKSPFLMSGCKVADGAGIMLVTGVGINTEWGLLMASISEDNGEETPLQVRLNGVTTFIGIVGLTVAFSVLIVLLARYFTGTSKNPDGTVQFVRGQTSIGHTIDGVIHIITAAVTIVVVAVPEGLPLAVTLTLAYSMKKMMADKALVRRLSACETMGSATTICSDKTGTLTLNQMTVVEAYVGKKKIDPPEDGSQLPPSVSSLLDEGLAQNTSGSVFLSKDGEIEVSGSPTEKAILQWGVKLGMKFDIVRSESIVLHVSPFNSTKKRGGVAVRGRTGSKVHVHWKGAAEIILASCSQYNDISGSVQPIDNDMDFLKDAINNMAEKSLRCVAVAYKTFEADAVPTDQEQLAQWTLPEDDLVLLAIIGIKDPCRPGVREAVELCTHAGVKVRMVTGDNIQTAKAIAQECSILSSNADTGEPYVMEGKRFRELSEKDREQAANLILVMGRSSPTDKLLLVQTLRKQGEVVAVTGDGTNDAPALNEADIGLSMGIQGTEVAKESSDIIILDDNFASVVKVVRWGRSVYANIQKFIQFQLTVNVAALTINVVAAVSSGDVPLNTVQLLWVNLIMDTLGALALATEPPTDHLMDRSPVGRRESLVTNIMWRNLIIQAIYQVAVLLVLNFCGLSLLKLKNDNDIEHANMVKNTVVFNTFVLCQIFNEFNARKPDELNVFTGVTKNHLFTGIVGSTFILQIIIINFLGKFTSTVRLNFPQWLICFIIGIISWPLAVAGKFIPVPKTPLGKVFIKPYQRCIAARDART